MAARTNELIVSVEDVRFLAPPDNDTATATFHYLLTDFTEDIYFTYLSIIHYFSNVHLTVNYVMYLGTCLPLGCKDTVTSLSSSGPGFDRRKDTLLPTQQDE